LKWHQTYLLFFYFIFIFILKFRWDLSIFKDVDRYKRAKQIVAGNTYLLLDKNSDSFITKGSNGLINGNDNETTNIKHIFESTGASNVYKIKNSETNQYYESNSGTLVQAASSTSRTQQWTFALQVCYYNILIIFYYRVMDITLSETLQIINISQQVVVATTLMQLLH
jgi:hypothetical protein